MSSDDYGYLEDPQNFVFIMHSLLSIGVPVYIFGGYCIIYKTPKSMASMKMSMMSLHIWSCWLDICICLLFIPYTLYPSSAGFPLGIMMYFHIPATAQIYFGASFAGVAAISVLGFFENRYNIVVAAADSTASRHIKRKIYMAFNYFTCFLFFLPPSLATKDITTAQYEMKKKYPFIRAELYNQPDFFIFPNNFIISVSCLPFMLSIILQCLYFVILTSYALLRYKSTSNATYKLQKRYFIIMCIQVSLPVSVFVIPMFYNMTSVHYNYYNQNLNCLMIICRGVHGILSTIVMVLVYKPYRSFLLMPLTRIPYMSQLSIQNNNFSNNIVVTS